MKRERKYLIYAVIDGVRAYHTKGGNEHMLYIDKNEERYIKVYTEEEADAFLKRRREKPLIDKFRTGEPFEWWLEKV